MKFTSLFLCNFSFLFANALSKHLRDDFVGVSNENLIDYITKASEGFRKVILNGDDDLGIPVLDPYHLEDLYWDYTEEPSKHELYLNSQNISEIRRLSEFQLNYINVHAASLSASFVLYFKKIEAEGPYKLDGRLFKNSMPVYGDGNVKLDIDHCYIAVDIGLEVDEDLIFVEKVHAYPIVQSYNATVDGLMDVPSDFASLVVNDQLEVLYKHFPKRFEDFVKNLVEDAIAGMTMDELFDYFDYLVDKVRA